MTRRVAFNIVHVQPLLWLAPALCILIPFFVLPLIAIVWVSFSRRPSASPAGGADVLAAYSRALSDAYYHTVYGDTLAVAAGVTAGTLILAFPLAYFIVRWAGRSRLWLIWILYLPLIVSVIVRVFGWMVITADQGLLNRALLDIGLVEQPLRILYEVEAMLAAMTHRYLPLMVLPLVNAIAKIDPQLYRAATNLGAGRMRLLYSVVLPLSLPGIVAGTQLVFAAVLSDFVMPWLVGTTRFPMLAPTIYDEAVQQLNWPIAASLSTLLLLFVLFYLVATNFAYRRLAPWARGL